MAGTVEGRSSGSRSAIVRRAIASTASLGMAAILFETFRRDAEGHNGYGWDWIPVSVLIAAPALAAAAIWMRPVSLQLLARASWWLFLLFACLSSITGISAWQVVALSAGSAGALLGAGRLGLDDSSGRFRPVAFRGTLMLALVLAMADAAAFSWMGIVHAYDGKFGLIFFAPLLIAGVIGLLRLRTWGLLVSIACNVLVAVLAGARVLDLPDDYRRLYVGMAIVQLLIPLPMLITIIRRRPAPPDRWRRAKAIASTCVILLVAAIAIGARVIGVPYRAP